MDPMNAIEAIQWFATLHLIASVAASFVKDFLPLPAEIKSARYRIFYGVIERLSMSKRKQWSDDDRKQGKC